METGNEGRNEKKFKNFGKRVDDFMMDLNDASEKLQKEFKEKFEELKATCRKNKKRIRKQRTLEGGRGQP